MPYDWSGFKKTFNEIWMKCREDDEGYVDCLNDLMERIARLHGGEPAGIETSLEFYIAHWGKEILEAEKAQKSMRSIYPVEDWALALVRANQDKILAVQVKNDRIIVVLKEGMDMSFIAHRREYKATGDKTKIEVGGDWGRYFGSGMQLAEQRWRIRRFEDGIWK